MSTKDFDEIDFDEIPADDEMISDSDETDDIEDDGFDDETDAIEDDGFDVENGDFDDDMIDEDEDTEELFAEDEEFEEDFSEDTFSGEGEALAAGTEDAVRKYDPDDYTEEDFDSVGEGNGSGSGSYPEFTISEEEKKSGRAFPIVLGIGLGFLVLVIVFAGWALFTKSGSEFIGGCVARFGLGSLGKSIGDEETGFILNNFGITLEEDELAELLAKKDKERDKEILKLIFDKYGIATGDKEIEDILEKEEGSLDVERIKAILRGYGVDMEGEDRIRAILEAYEITVSDEDLRKILEKDERGRSKDVLKLIFDGYAMEITEEELDSILDENGEVLSLEEVKTILGKFGILSSDDLTPTPIIDDNTPVIRSEDYVKTYLIFGIESVRVGDNGEVYYDNSSIGNTDAILLVSVNSQDKTIKMTSIMRDTFVEIPGYFSNKINAAYALGAKGSKTAAEAHEKGAAMLTKVIENTFRIKISGWACVNFASFEKIVDRLGGIDLELGKEEAA